MSSKNTKSLATMKDSHIVKIAVKKSGAEAQLIQFNQQQPLAATILELCNNWNISDPNLYALQFYETNDQKCITDKNRPDGQSSEIINQRYVTEKNRNEIKNGFILKLEHSPSKTAQDLLQKLNLGSSDERLQALQKLATLRKDVTFALEFISKKGLSLLINKIESEKCKPVILAHCLQSFVDLMDHGIVSWDILESRFINKVASYVINQSESLDPQIICCSLSILENIVQNSTNKYAQVEQEIPFPNLVMHLQHSSHPMIQLNAIALINALFIKSDLSKRNAISATLCSKQVRNVILTNILHDHNHVGTEMAHQLYVLQTLSLGLLEQRKMLKMDPNDVDAMDKIKELRRIAFENEGSLNISDAANRKQLDHVIKDFKKLGFRYDVNPALDFNETPPGMLALDCMLYFAKNHTEAYTKVVLENSCRADEHECPFGRTSVELTKLLCEILGIGEQPSEQGQAYHPMFFTHDRPFEELFCICIVILNKTWKDMRASIEDFVKVMGVVREQITHVLKTKPINLDKFKQKIQQVTYAEITNIRQQERASREEWESKAKPIIELKEQITPDILELIQQQRLNYLIDGTRFTKYSNRGNRIKDKFWFVCLAPNRKAFHYADCDEKYIPNLEELTSKVSVVDIKSLVTGKDCPHMKDVKGRKTTHQLAFSLILDSIDIHSLDFVAPDELTFDYWLDGVNALLGNEMTSASKSSDLEKLLSMDIKLRLLDVEGLEIPQNPPSIPPPPENYDFCFEA
ncbi:engulfment and cell motility protein 1 [Ctenocephalides felis]|uniref:engulfment and cell motility protein 1 n=1 Tax=Ctenocephalides felis TaxID=7515 RepID=UPI000E6E323B|nr:engulfment and cell motility protein 1 [Ctenocephalides felis]